MESYCVKCKKYTKNIDPKVLGTSNGKLSKRATCERTLGLKTPPSKVRVLGDILY